MKTIHTFRTLTLFGLIIACAQLLMSAELVRVNIDGKPTDILQKLITNKRSGVWQGDRPKTGRKTLVTPFNIFFQAKTDSGAETEDGFFRIADQNGTPLGWISEKNVVAWETRYAILPIDSNKKGTFITYLDPGQVLNKEGQRSTAGYKSEYLEDSVPKGVSKFCFILKRESKENTRDSDGPFKVILATAESSASGSTAQLQTLENLDLEIVFVLEATDFMTLKYTDAAGNKSKHDLMYYVRGMMTNFAKAVERIERPDGSSPAKLGFVIYHDTNDDAAEKTPKVICDLTSDVRGKFLDELKRLKPAEIKGDEEEDGLSGIYTAMKHISWGTNSVKHIVVLGQGPFQKYGKKDKWKPDLDHYLDIFIDRGHRIYHEGLVVGEETINWDWSESFGHNSSGKSIGDIKRMSQPKSGASADQKLKGNKYLHALWFGKDVKKVFNEQKARLGWKITYDELMKMNKDMEQVRIDNNLTKQEMLEHWLNMKYGDDAEDKNIASWISYAFALGRIDMTQNQAQKDYEDLITGEGYGTLGLYRTVDPDEESAQRAGKELNNKIKATITAMTDLGGDYVDTSTMDNEMLIPLQKIVNQAGETVKGINAPTLIGSASTRSEETGRTVATKVIMVREEDLERLKQTFADIHRSFKDMGSKLTNVAELLEELKRSIASAAIGQDIKRTTKLKDIISSLPLRSKALDYTADNLSVMQPKEFQAWLEQINRAETNTQRLLDEAQWVHISDISKKTDRYAFIEVTDLP